MIARVTTTMMVKSVTADGDRTSRWMSSDPPASAAPSTRPIQRSGWPEAVEKNVDQRRLEPVLRCLGEVHRHDCPENSAPWPTRSLILLAIELNTTSAQMPMVMPVILGPCAAFAATTHEAVACLLTFIE
jgi:hypothetical protein